MVVTGPLSSYSVSKLSQNIRFEKILEANNMISGNKAIKQSEHVSKTDREAISSILLYFQNKHKLDDLKYLPNDFEINKAKDVFGFDLEQEYWGGPKDKYFNYNVIQDGGLIDIKSYDYFADYSSYMERNTKDIKANLSVFYSEQSRTIEIFEKGNVVYTKNIDDIATSIHKKIYIDNDEKHQVKIDEMIYVDDTSSMEVLYIFNNISGMESLDGRVTIYPPMFYIFVKLK